MFKRSRIKIIVAIMAALLLFLLVMAGMIYGSSYRELSKENRAMLEQFCDGFDLNQAYMETHGARLYVESEVPPLPDVAHDPGTQGNDGYTDTEEPEEPEYPGDMDEPEDPDPGVDPDNDDGLRPPSPIYKEDREMHAYAVSSFYYTAFDSTGRPLLTGYGNGSVYAEEDIQSMATEILKSGKTQGTVGDLIYQVTDKGPYTLVAFMDNTVVRGSMETFLKYALISFGISAVLVFFLALVLSKKIIKPLEENDLRQKQFVSDAGHELKTPIAVMSSNLELLSREVGEDNQWLQNIQYENERMGALVRDLLELSHAETGTPVQDELDLSTLVEGEVLPFESIAFEEGLTLESDIAQGISVQGNPGQLKQLTAILLDNAISHSEGGNTVDIKLAPDRHQAMLTVINSGPEIPQDQREKLFERFYKTDEARIEDGGHYGLGLAIAKAIVQAHNGSIGVDCGEGKVTFRVAIPMKK